MTGTTPDRMDQIASLQGRLLIAMPGLDDPNFDHSVVYICQHDAESAMGIVLNHPVSGLNFGRMMAELEITLTDDQHRQDAIYNGGPVQTDRGFVLHSLDYYIEDITLPMDLEPDLTALSKGIGLTISRDILVDLARGKGPSRSLIALGYAGWDAGQLEAEIRENAWLIAPSHPDLIFSHDIQGLWAAALKTLGISPEHLTRSTGQA
ncbi:MAG: YqgE/AlgH family protein [Asticcacaulis sp.]